MFRKHFVDAFTDVNNSPPRSTYKADIKADNGLIHMIGKVIYPGWLRSSAATARPATPRPRALRQQRVVRAQVRQLVACA